MYIREEAPPPPPTPHCTYVSWIVWISAFQNRIRNADWLIARENELIILSCWFLIRRWGYFPPGELACRLAVWTPSLAWNLWKPFATDWELIHAHKGHAILLLQATKGVCHLFLVSGAFCGLLRRPPSILGQRHSFNSIECFHSRG